jgi:hypothetical protein
MLVSCIPSMSESRSANDQERPVLLPPPGAAEAPKGPVPEVPLHATTPLLTAYTYKPTRPPLALLPYNFKNYLNQFNPNNSSSFNVQL